MTPDKLIEELDRIVKVPGLSNIWVPPIRNRIDMLATGIKSPVGVKVAGTDLAEIDRIAAEIERVVKDVPGRHLRACRAPDRRALHRRQHRPRRRGALRPEHRRRAERHRVGDRRREHRRDGRRAAALSDQRALSARAARLGREAARACRSLTERGAQIRARRRRRRSRITDGPPMLKSENARLSGWVYVDIRGRDLRVGGARHAAGGGARRCKLPAGYSISWSGQFEFLERATARLKVVVPVTLLIIFVLLYLTFRRFDEALLIMATLPFALVGGFWLLYLLGHNVSVASAVGFIALAGVAAEFGVIMLIYLKHAWEARMAAGKTRRSRSARRDPRRRGAARAAEGDDGGRDHRRPAADHVGQQAPARR